MEHQVPFSAAMLCVVMVVTVVALVAVLATTARWLSLTVISHRCLRFAKGILPQEHRLCTQGGLVLVRSLQSPGTSKCQLGNERFVSSA